MYHILFNAEWSIKKFWISHGSHYLSVLEWSSHPIPPTWHSNQFWNSIANKAPYKLSETLFVTISSPCCSHFRWKYSLFSRDSIPILIDSQITPVHWSNVEKLLTIFYLRKVQKIQAFHRWLESFICQFPQLDILAVVKTYFLSHEFYMFAQRYFKNKSLVNSVESFLTHLQYMASGSSIPLLKNWFCRASGYWHTTINIDLYKGTTKIYSQVFDYEIPKPIALHVSIFLSDRENLSNLDYFRFPAATTLLTGQNFAKWPIFRIVFSIAGCNILTLLFA